MFCLLCKPVSCSWCYLHMFLQLFIKFGHSFLIFVFTYVGGPVARQKKKKKFSFKVQACLRSDIRKLEAQSSFPENSIRGSRVSCKERLLDGIPNSCQCLKKIPDDWEMAILDFWILDRSLSQFLNLVDNFGIDIAESKVYSKLSTMRGPYSETFI